MTIYASEATPSDDELFTSGSSGTQPEPLPEEGSETFYEKANEILDQLIAKYAWTAQQGGIVLRADPLKMEPLRDYVFNRISKAHYSFRYRDKRGRVGRFYYGFDQLLSILDEPENPSGLVIAERIEFLPGQPEVTEDQFRCKVLNLWRRPPWKLSESAPEPSVFLEHMDYLMDGDRNATAHILNFLAHMIQRPRERIGHALLITSEAKGIGKSTLGQIARSLVGERNSRVAQTKDMKSQFDGWLLGKLVVVVDEVYEAGNWDLANKLKPLITEPTISVNVKYGPQLEINNYARLIMFSNHTAPLNIEDGDRRYFVFDSKAQPRETSYYDRLYAYIGSESGMSEIYTFLMSRDLSGFSPHRRPPMTTAKEQIIEVSTNPLRAYLQEAVESGHLRENLGDEFTLDALMRLLHKDGYGTHAKNMKELSASLELAGVQNTRQTRGGRKVRLWILPQSGEPLPEGPPI